MARGVIRIIDALWKVLQNHQGRAIQAVLLSAPVLTLKLLNIWDCHGLNQLRWPEQV